MVSVDPVKTVGVCFLKTSFQTEYFIRTDDLRSIQTLPSFLEEFEAVIIALENFSPEETHRLKEEEKQRNTAIFAPPDCFGGHCLRRGYKCERVCALEPKRHR
jgi:hypothetical protein